MEGNIVFFIYSSPNKISFKHEQNCHITFFYMTFSPNKFNVLYLMYECLLRSRQPCDRSVRFIVLTQTFWL